MAKQMVVVGWADGYNIWAEVEPAERPCPCCDRGRHPTTGVQRGVCGGGGTLTESEYAALCGRLMGMEESSG